MAGRLVFAVVLFAIRGLLGSTAFGFSFSLGFLDSLRTATVAGCPKLVLVLCDAHPCCAAANKLICKRQQGLFEHWVSQ